MARLALVLLLAACWAGPGWAADWGGIAPGVTTQAEVRARYGVPSREVRDKLEGYDTARWVYEGARAPVGMFRMTVDFGLLTPEGYRAAVVRVLRIDPRPGVFPRITVEDGWGAPDGVSTEDNVYFYASGLIVTFDKERENAATMIFSLPQPHVLRPGPERK